MMDSELYNVLAILSLLSPLIPLLAIFLLKLYSDKIVQLFILLLLESFISDILSLLLAQQGLKTDVIIHIYTILTGALIYLFYYYCIKSSLIKSVVVIMMISLITIELIEILALNGINESNFLSYTYLSLSILALSLIFFIHKMKIITVRKEIFDNLFWFNSAFLLFFGSTLIITLFEHYIRVESPEIFIFIWPIQLFANIVFYILLLKGLWTMKKM